MHLSSYQKVDFDDGDKISGLCSNDVLPEEQYASLNENSHLEVGTRCYARWPEDNLWYWGFVTHINQENNQILYTVEFDDGGILDVVCLPDIIAERSILAEDATGRLERESRQSSEQRSNQILEQ